MEEKTKKDQKTPAYKKKRRRLGLLLILTAVLTLGTLITAWPMVIQGSEQGAIIRIPKNASVENVRDSLTSHFGEDYASKVMKLFEIRKVDWKKRHGAYLIKEGDTPYETMRKLSSGAQYPVRLVINDYRGEEVLADRIAAKVDFTAEEFLKAAKDSENLKKYGLTPDDALSLFLNDTYEVYWSSSPETVVNKIAKNFRNFWTPQRKEKAAALGLTPSQATIIASIVSEETNDWEEKATVGRLYVNRLNKGMKLQADPTVRFAIGDFTIKRVTRDHLSYDSPYNTYKYAGLPPGPIRTASKSTIDQLLNSQPNDYLYMCAKEDFSGKHNFAVTYEEHLKNAKRYQEELDRRGIK